MRIVCLMGAKKISKRLPNKAWKMIGGIPMFEHNIAKGVEIFDEMYVTSDDDTILNRAKEMGAIPIKRTDPKLMEAPNIDYYLHALKYMGEMKDGDYIVALQINSPTVDRVLIRKFKQLAGMFEEIKTCHLDASDYGSIWAMSIERLKNYPDPYKVKPDVWVVDNSTDIHTMEDFNKAKKELCS